MYSKVNARDESRDLQYPMLGIYPDSKQVTLFITMSHGVVVDSGESNYPIGCIADDWSEDWEPFMDSVTLSNREFQT